ncbi:hypothetical protein OG407_43040 [Streptomyces sp. NBC_01515]|uniref:hypothetical protein n=1 Tax=Streptomyces sp. NBC_01515 TaxID=2903890 RepID=UPI0038671409
MPGQPSEAFGGVVRRPVVDYTTSYASAPRLWLTSDGAQRPMQEPALSDGHGRRVTRIP